MSEVTVTATRTGSYFHSSIDQKVTACGRKVTTKYGPVGTPVETMTMDSDEVFTTPAIVNCEKCLAGKK